MSYQFRQSTCMPTGILQWNSLSVYQLLLPEQKFVNFFIYVLTYGPPRKNSFPVLEISRIHIIFKIT